MTAHHRVPFTEDDDALLMKFIATHHPHQRGRLGIKLYEKLVENEEGKWSFSTRHPVQSWRERYKTNQPWFDAKILRYQKKHGIPPDAPVVSSQATGQNSASKTSAHAGPSRSSPLPAGSGSKKRAREVNADDLGPDPWHAKKMRRENVTVQESRTCDVAPRSVSPRVERQNKGKRRAEFSSPPRHEEDEDLSVTGPNDYNGALDAESEGEKSQSDGGQSNESSSPSPPSSPIKKTRSKPSANVKNSSRLSRAGVSAVPKEPLASSSHQQHSPEHSPSTTQPSAPKASSSRRKLVITPPQLSQEPTPPHSSPRNSPASPLPRERSHTTSPSPQPETAHKPHRVASLKQRRSHVIVDEEEDDIFCTPPVQSPPSSPPLRARARDAPRLVEGPYRSTYTRANGSHRPAPRGRSASEDSEEAEAEADDNEWPPRRGKQDAPIPSQERSTPTDVDRSSVQHIDLRVLHSRKSVERFRTSSNRSFGSTSRTREKTRRRQAKAPRSSTPPNLSESNKELVLALGLEEVYKRMADNHKFHVDIVREVAARQRSLEQADKVLRSMREAAEHEYARLLKREFGVALETGAQQTEESDEEEEEAEEGEEEEEEEEEVAKNLRNEEHDHSTPLRSASPHATHSPPDISMTNGGDHMEEDADAMELDEVPTNQADKFLPGSQALPDVEWTDDDDELLLDGDLVVHEELVRRKGLGSVKFRTADLYSLLLLDC